VSEDNDTVVGVVLCMLQVDGDYFSCECGSSLFVQMSHLAYRCVNCSQFYKGDKEGEE
jgi:hypothetical protein